LSSGKLDAGKTLVPLVIFLTHGSHGDFGQIPPIFNAFYNHTLTLNNASKLFHYHLFAFSFDLKKMPSVFSNVMVKAQANFVSESIKFVLDSTPLI